MFHIQQSNRQSNYSTFHCYFFAALLFFCEIVIAQEINDSILAQWNSLHDRTVSSYQGGDYLRAIAYAEDALKLAKDYFGENHTYTSVSYTHLTLPTNREV